MLHVPLIPVLVIIFIGALIRATFGFGDALIAMPLLALVVSLQIASPVVAFLSIIIGITILILNWSKVDFKTAWRLILSSAVGIPVGLYFLKTIPEQYIKALLGVVLVLFGGYNLIRPKLPACKGNWLAYVMGFLGGVFGGAYNANGPPVIIYGRLAHWEPDRFKATLQSYFMPTAAFIFIGHGLSGSWTREVLTLFGYTFPVIMAAIILGTWISKKITPGLFDRLVYMAIIGMGLLMFL